MQNTQETIESLKAENAKLEEKCVHMRRKIQTLILRGSKLIDGYQKKKAPEQVDLDKWYSSFLMLPTYTWEESQEANKWVDEFMKSDRYI
jgi:predicted nuclease with TOPRIM domain